LGKNGPDPTPGPSAGDPPPEWAYHPGKAARSLAAAESFGRKVMALPAQWRKIALDDAQRRSVNWFADWPRFVDKVHTEIAAGAARAQGAATPLGFIPESILGVLVSGQALNGRKFVPVNPRTALVATTDRAVYHALRDAKFTDRPQLRERFVQALHEAPDWVAAADAVLWNAADGVLMFARRGADGRYMTLIARVDLRERRTREPVVAAWVRTVEVHTAAALRQHALIAGRIE